MIRAQLGLRIRARLAARFFTPGGVGAIPPVPTSTLLLETGDAALLESGDTLLLEG